MERFLSVNGECYDISKTGDYRVGRLSNNDIILSDPYISRLHFSINVDAYRGTCYLHDGDGILASSAGTTVNGVTYSANAACEFEKGTQLKHGDKITIGDVILTYCEHYCPVFDPNQTYVPEE
ncbi:MAG: FHA domain-containing protein [Symploca sp. SIO3E6]|nr:FHA domain-containing protein [Caldora sp. SIO3E6]